MPKWWLEVTSGVMVQLLHFLTYFLSQKIDHFFAGIDCGLWPKTGKYSTMMLLRFIAIVYTGPQYNIVHSFSSLG